MAQTDQDQPQPVVEPQPAMEADRDLLLREYELCQNSAQRLEGRVWSGAVLMGVVSLAAFVIGLLFLPAVRAETGLFFLLDLGILSVVVVVVWWLMANRWCAVQRTCYLRMYHIEQQLGMFQLRYMHYLDEPAALGESPLDKDRRTDLKQARSRHQASDAQSLIRILPLMNLLAWLIYVLILLGASAGKTGGFTLGR
ncbi:MAG: hypothetical protein GXY33_12590 [Phycisphaerae bacterium]|nr:hypothetical protein [Phycisphaerae bacterium]